jgi:hypothetical protein
MKPQERSFSGFTPWRDASGHRQPDGVARLRGRYLLPE